MKTLLLLGLMIGSVPMLNAQTYALPWSVVSSGGGASFGGSYAVQGTVGQSDAGGPLVATPYAVTGGFWAGVVSAPTTVPSRLSIERQADGLVRISWPLASLGWVLDESSPLATDPNTTSWSVVPFPYQTNADRVSVTVQPVGSKFYRLNSP